MIRQIKKLVAYTWRTSRTTNPTRSHYVVCIIVSNSHCSVICRIAPKKHNNGLKDNNVFGDQKQMQQSQKTVRWQPDGSNAKGYIPLSFHRCQKKNWKCESDICSEFKIKASEKPRGKICWVNLFLDSKNVLRLLRYRIWFLIHYFILPVLHPSIFKSNRIYEFQTKPKYFSQKSWPSSVVLCSLFKREQVKTYVILFFNMLRCFFLFQ